jgi:hypothetical protein
MPGVETFVLAHDLSYPSWNLNMSTILNFNGLNLLCFETQTLISV